jgi:oligopeptide/dipeptide ABC transporter ATP-binding protein
VDRSGAPSSPGAVAVFAARGVTVRSARREHRRPILHDVSVQIGKGEIVGLAGESGSGKSTLCRLAAGLLREGTMLTDGAVSLNGEDVTLLPSRALHRIRPGGVSLVFQDPMAALNPVRRIGDQVAEAIDPRPGYLRRGARAQAAELLAQMGFPDAQNRMSAYPDQLSGGQRQRVVLAMALASGPALLLADEPTSSLDVRIQSQILRLLATVASDRGVAILLVSHDFGVISEICDRVYVMYGGEIVETGDVDSVLEHPAHPYTARLIESLPSVRRRVAQLPVIPGRPPTLEELTPGCSFRSRCLTARDECATTPMKLTAVAPGHETSCIVRAGQARLTDGEMAL